jgi:hypothetical protein
MASNRSQWIVLAATAAGGFGLGRLSNPAVLLVAVLIVALAAAVGIIWRSRVQSARRWRAALDAYADRTLDQRHHRFPRNARVA